MISNFVIDFDGTIADTLTRNPNSIGVDEGYEYAIRIIFGEEGLTAYRKIGGLKNRAPTELVKELLKEDNNSSLFDKARNFFYEMKGLFENLVPEEKGFLLEWPTEAINLDEITLRTISKMVVRIKLSFLMKEIGTMQKNGKTWPEPCRGFIDFFKFIHKMNEKKEGTFRVVILSSGHEFFIKKVFRSWGISPLPDMLTDDDLRDSSLKETVAKPSAALFDILRKKTNENKSQEQPLNTKNTLYIGDDLEKDGELAKNARIPFMLFCGNDKKFEDSHQSFFDDWKTIISLLEKQQISG
ncbi:MAG: hypothetical protein KAI57_04890 [Candidatus Pacebacteria bacterium]|nr:hypothetical protein [Candidatus Paceibacterota bacterium]